MALIVADRVKETTTTTGTGALTLAGAMTGFVTFASKMANGDTCYYAAQAVDASGQATGEWEVGLGTSNGSTTLTRTTVLASSNGGAAVSFSAGTKQVWIDIAAAQLAQPFDVHAFYPGIPPISAKVLRIPVARAVAFPANFAGSYAKAGSAATASTAFDVQKNGSSIGTVTFAAAGTVATFTSASGAAQSLAAGDVLSIIAPATADLSIADVGFVLAGTR